MNIKVTKSIGNNVIELTSTEPEFKKAMSEVVPFTQPDVCDLCKKEEIYFDTNKANTEKGQFIYIKRRCKNCGGQSTLGEYKGGGYFWKAWEIYKPKDNNTNTNTGTDEPIINTEI